jgi:hypothetical protein
MVSMPQTAYLFSITITKEKPVNRRPDFRQTLQTFAARFFRPAPDTYAADPLSHPDLAGMSQSELADLPFDPYALPRASRVAARQTEAGRDARGLSAAKPCIAGARPL